MNSVFRHRKLVPALLALVLGAAVLSGCGESGEEPSPAPDYSARLAGAPAPLASLYEQGNELLTGGLDAYDQRISGLEGYPAVVNVWASWCGPCRAEFPHFQQVSANMGKKVGFLGVNSDDNRDAAETFLSTHQVPYPSYEDPDKSIADSVDATFGFPATAFYNADGELTYTKSGPYTSNEELVADIRNYALENDAG
jgi:thiol-disulfide isomerase/thioredoxin